MPQPQQPPPREAAAAGRTQEQLAGKLVDHGRDAYRHDPNENPSYFVRPAGRSRRRSFSSSAPRRRRLSEMKRSRQGRRSASTRSSRAPISTFAQPNSPDERYEIPRTGGDSSRKFATHSRRASSGASRSSRYACASAARRERRRNARLSVGGNLPKGRSQRVTATWTSGCSRPLLPVANDRFQAI